MHNPKNDSGKSVRDIIVGVQKQGSLFVPVVELSRQMSSCKDLVVEPSQLGSLKGLSGTRNTGVILVWPLTVKVKAYVQLRWYYLGFR